MQKFTASFLGRDCPGVVASVSRILEESGCNIEEVTQTILSGEFAAIFVVAAPEKDAESLRAKLNGGLEAAKVDLSVLVRPAIKGQWGTDLHCEPFVVTADGPDKPGLIAAMVYRHKVVDRQRFEVYRRRFSPYGSVASLYLWAIAGGALPHLTDPAGRAKTPPAHSGKRACARPS